MSRKRRPDPKPGYLWCSGYEPLGLPEHEALIKDFGKHSGKAGREYKQTMCKDCKDEYNAFYNPTTNRNPKYDGTRKKCADERRHRQYDIEGVRVEKVPLIVVYRKYDATCWLCRKRVNYRDASRDHVIPVTGEGDSILDNYRLAHKSCNSRRGNKPLGSIQPLLDEMRHPDYVPGQIIDGVFQTFRRPDEVYDRERTEACGDEAGSSRSERDHQTAGVQQV